MLLWVVLAMVTAAAVLAVLAPLRAARPAIGAPDPAAHDPALDIYRDQLAEIEADRARGLIEPEQAQSARIEISRRLLRQAGERAADGEAPATVAAQAAARPGPHPALLPTMALIPVLALGGYLALGSPSMPGAPLAERRAAALERSPERAQIELLIAKVEERLRTHPDDAQGWEVVAPVYARLGRMDEALEAWRQTIRLSGESRPRLQGLVEASLFVTGGLVTTEARQALGKLLAGNPADPITRFWLATARQQDGQTTAAIADLEALLREAPAEAPWRATIEERLAAWRGVGGAPAAAATTAPAASGRGPTAEDVAAAQRMAPTERAQMIAGMVEGLAERLAKDGRDVEGWVKLINAYSVLGKKQEALAALGRAKQALAADKAAQARLMALAKQLQLGS